MKGIKDTITGKFKRNLIDKECLRCKNVFKPRHGKQKFCGKKCEASSKKKDKNRSCVICNKLFWATNMKTRFCSQKCYSKSGLRTKKGSESHLWKGGITPKNQVIRTSTEYKLWRTAVFERDNYTCVWCGIVGVVLNADHIKPFALYPELRFAIDNGRTLCVPCHKTTDTYAGKLVKNIKI